MGEIIRTWLQSRLGVIIDLTPEVFGHYSKDGTLLAKLLYNYDIINDTQLETITQTQDSALARVNLKHLRAWSKFIGVDFDDDCLEDISNGRGTAALRVFYKLFLCLEMKDRLHFITLQKERERYIPASTQFDITIVSERPPPAEPIDHPLSAPLVTSAGVIEWHRKKFLHAIDRYRHVGAPFRSSGEHDKMADGLPAAVQIPKKEKSLEEDNEIDEFSRNHPAKSSSFNDRRTNIDPSAAKNYIKALSHRKNRSSAVEESKSQSQNDVLSSVWGRIEDDQERKLNEMIARGVLRESQYEKRMLKKLIEIRKDKNRMSDNRRLVESLMQKAKEESFRADEERRLEESRRNTCGTEDERQRSAELDRRVANRKLQRSEDYLQELGRQLTEDLTSIAMICGDYRDLNYEDVPRKVWQEWKALFIQGLAVLYPEEMFELDEVLGGEGEEAAEGIPGLIRREELLDERDLEEYLKLSGPWEEFLPEVYEFQDLGQNVLGHVVHKLLGVLHPLDARPSPSLPAYPIRVALLGLPDSSLHPFLRELLSCEGIATVQVEDTIKFCLEKYKKEVKDFEFVDLELNGTRESLKTSDVGEVDESKADKKTQTPRMIPYEDMHPLLSDAAFVGKSIHQLLSHGQRIPEEVIPKTVVAYLKSLEGIQGWVTIDYPCTYQQLAQLESALSAKPWDSLDSKEDDEENEGEGLIRSSRLVPNPLASESDSTSHSHLTSFIRMTEKSRSSEEENEVDRFYIDQGLASVFQYTFWDFETLEQLCGIIMGKGGGSGQVVETMEQLGGSLESFESTRTIVEALEERELLPGEAAWTYADSPQDKHLLEELGSCWISLESSYINGLLEVLSLKRFTFLAVLPYKDFMMKYMFEFAGQADERQHLLREFQKAFNDVPEDMRNDEEVKYELHCRVKDFQTQLWEICDRKRRNCLEKREDIVLDHWTTGQLIILVNIYLAMMQIELNRFVDTAAIVEGYYSAITKKDARDRPLKPRLQRVFLGDDPVEDGKDEDLESSTKSPSPKLNKLDLQKEIEGILLAKEGKPFEVDNTIAFRIIRANVGYCQSFVDDVFSSASAVSKKSDKKSKEVPPNPKKIGKKRPSKRASKLQTKTGDAKPLEDEKRLENVLKEWRSVLMYEVTRVKTLLDVLESAWQSDVEFLLTTIQHGLHLIEERINEIYRNELKSIKEMARVFCLAIEHHKPISGEMMFDGDRFIMNFEESKNEDIFKLLKGFPPEESDDLNFKIAQLGRLKDIFKRVAPSGSLPQRSFVFILQDLITCGKEDDKEPLVPPSWLKLDPPDVFELVHEIFGDDPHVDWREFLVYGMDLERPTQDQLLETLEHLRKKDESLCGVLPKAVFLNIPLWFHEKLLSPSINSWLHDDFEYECEFWNRSSRSYEESWGNLLRVKPRKKTISFRTDSVERKHLGVDDVTSEDVRLNLTKELLCEIFVERKEDVNYLRVLLAFCKDQDPRKGLTGALSVTLNRNVCGSFQDGEKFLQESFRMKEDYDILRAGVLKDTQQILDEILGEIFDSSEKIGVSDMDDVSLKIDDMELRKSGPLSVEVLDAILTPTSPIKMADDQSSVASVTDSPTASMEKSHDSSICSQGISEQSSGNCEFTREVHHWIPMTVFENFFTDLIPNINEKISVISPERTLSEHLKRIHEETKCEELNDSPEMVLAHRVINHEFVSRLLEITTKFTWKNLGKAVERIIQRKNE
ncbi:sperm flagellar protein 2-like [Diachasma alloeum]|uniref:sperm flagellar protein 2-like n=1 Tax=Diachasma alloeum TaxID=454923 RepID=UPI0010FB3EFE|nr:sperm flagellar protein 2-like [Diachasma alloeum]